MVLTVWCGVKAPRPTCSDVPINGCVAFRVVILEPVRSDQDRIAYRCRQHILSQTLPFCKDTSEHIRTLFCFLFLLPIRANAYTILYTQSCQDTPAEWQCSAKSLAYVLRLESLVAILDVERSVEPLSPNGSYKIVLTEQSASVLDKVEELELWTVGHTMQRGQQKVVGDGLDFTGSSKKPAAKAKRKPSQKPTFEFEEVTADSIRRNAAGRAAIQQLIRQLLALDGASFKESPMFDLDGACRLEMAGASSFTSEDLVLISPKVLECTCLVGEPCIFMIVHPIPIHTHPYP